MEAEQEPHQPPIPNLNKITVSRLRAIQDKSSLGGRPGRWVDKLIVRSMGLVSISDISVPTFKVSEICIEICTVQKGRWKVKKKYKKTDRLL
jgi:hypothetical protein